MRNSAIPTYVARVLTLSSRSHTPHLALFDGFKGTAGMTAAATKTSWIGESLGGRSIDDGCGSKRVRLRIIGLKTNKNKEGREGRLGRDWKRRN